MRLSLFAALILCASPAALAQNAPSASAMGAMDSNAMGGNHVGLQHTDGGTTVALPEICGAAPANTENVATSQKQMTGDMDAGHVALMSGMDAMHSQMMAGMQAQDVDVAFVCGMIPHHQGAISMARAELDHGDDPFARQVAERVIAAQEAEIAEMLDWLGEQSK